MPYPLIVEKTMVASEITPQRPAPFRHRQPTVPSRRRQAPRQWSRSTVAIALEVTTKLGVNLILISLATSAVARLLPYYRSVEEKLDRVEIEVAQTQERVNQLQQDFDRSFDPEQAKEVMAEQSHRIDPQRRSVVWKKGKPAP